MSDELRTGDSASTTGGQHVAIVVPTLNEAKNLTELARNLQALDPPATEILLVDGGSEDETVTLGEELGFRVLKAERGRSKQINAGVSAAASRIVCILHADTMLPPDAVLIMFNTLRNKQVALASFTPLIRGRKKVRWFSTFHGWLKTWYAPLIFRPRLFFRGTRLLFGDHAMFFRRADFLAVGGCNPETHIMEDAELCINLGRLGRVRLVHRLVATSDRRMEQWGELRANWIALKIGVSWALGRRAELDRDYPAIR